MNTFEFGSRPVSDCDQYTRTFINIPNAAGRYENLLGILGNALPVVRTPKLPGSSPGEA